MPVHDADADADPSPAVACAEVITWPDPVVPPPCPVADARAAPPPADAPLCAR
ncbi:MAG: hypothetical protein M3235_18745 [Actinomycetota bacterium]|nr:hypothetical protein [Actinomycetota bacterium]